jgi:hypothetical protein
MKKKYKEEGVVKEEPSIREGDTSKSELTSDYEENIHDKIE